MLAIPEDMLRMLQAALMHCMCSSHIRQSLQVRRIMLEGLLCVDNGLCAEVLLLQCKGW